MPDNKKYSASDKRFMSMALGLAEKVRGLTSPDPSVGAVLVKNGRIISVGFHDKHKTPHAESFALKKAGKAARGATLYINLEPCCHWGNNPPCTAALIKAKVKRVVAAMKDPNPLVNGKGFRALKKAGITVDVGLMEKEAYRLNEGFFKHITTRKPFVTLKAAMSLDGKIATGSGQSRWISGELSREYVQELRRSVDAVIVGIGTVLSDDPRLTYRHKSSGKTPMRIILDSKARTPLDARVMKDKAAGTIIAVTSSAPGAKVVKLKKAGAEVITCKAKNGKVDLKALMTELGKRGILSVMLESGGRLSGAAIEAGIVDKVIIFIAPKIIGGEKAPSPVEGKGVTDLINARHLRDVTVKRLGHDIVVEGYIGK